MTWFTYNAVSADDTTVAMYMEAETREQVERACFNCGLILDEAGVCEMVEVPELN